MPRRARAIGLALTSAALLAGSVLTTAPASAVTTDAKAGSLTAAWCQAQGGTYAKSGAVKTCTITYPQVTRTNADVNTAQQRTPPYLGVSPDVAAMLTADGYRSDYQTSTTYAVTKTYTQKGGGSITGGFLVDTPVNTFISFESCDQLLLLGGNYTPNGPVPLSLCAALGMYPTNLVYVGP